MSRPNPITPVVASGLQAAFDHLNVTLFDGSLPADTFIVYARKATVNGILRRQAV